MKAWPESRRRPLPPVRSLWAILGTATPINAIDRAIVYRIVRHNLEGRGYTLGELMLASGVIE